MKQEKIDALVKGLFELEDNVSIDINTTEDGVTTIVIKSLEDSDKLAFEKWVDKMPDDFFTEVWENLAEDYSLIKLNDMYSSKDYKKVIDLFRNKAIELANKKIELFSEMLG